MTTQELPDLVLQVHGPVWADAADYLRGKLAAVAEHAHQPILHIRVRLTEAGDPAVSRPAIAQANLDLNGRLLRAHVAAPTMREAIDLLHDRLVRRLDHLALNWESHRGDEPMAPAEHEWRHDALSSQRPVYFPRPPEQRKIVRHKSFTLAVERPDEAAFDMDTMDYDFHLFGDLDTGLDAVIYRGGPTGYRIARTEAGPAPAAPTAVPLTVSPQAAPRLSVAEAVERLNSTDWPFVFFVNPATERGNILYHRYDGHYGLITPAD